MPGVSGTMTTVAPSCGMPLESRTCPESLPPLEMVLLGVCAARGEAHVTPIPEAKTIPKHRSAQCFTRLPPWRNVCRGLRLHRILHREFGRARDGGVSQ